MFDFIEYEEYDDGDNWYVDGDANIPGPGEGYALPQGPFPFYHPRFRIHLTD